MDTLKLFNSVRLATAFALSLLLSAAFYSASGKPQSDTKTEDRPVSNFHEVEIGGAFRVILVQGDKESVTVEADAEMMPKIITKVKDGSLEIYTDKSCHNGRAGTVTVYFKNLKSIESSGSVNISCQGKLNFDDLSLETSGSSKTVLSLSAKKLDVDISGASNTELNGAATNVDLDISGSGHYKAADLTSEKYEVEISGVGTADLMASQTLDISISGSGTINYKGDPKISQSISGSGKISKIQ